MKKTLLILALVICLCISAFTACADGKKNDSAAEKPSETTGKASQTIEKPSETTETGENPIETGEKSTETTEKSPETTEETTEDNSEGTGSDVNPDNLVIPQPPKSGCTYKDSVKVLSSNWNPHACQTTDDAYPISFLASGLYAFFFNDEVIYSLGREAYSGYVIAPEMAAALPIDVTAKVKLEHPEFAIPESAEAGYAYVIKLNPNAKWENGTPINADTYIYSMQQLLDPTLKNYRAADYFGGDLVIANAENYYYQGTTAYVDNGIGNKYRLADLIKGEDGNYYTADGSAMYVAVYYGIYWLGGYSLGDYVAAYSDAYFCMDNWSKLVAATGDMGLAPLNDDTYAWLLTTVTTNSKWGDSEDDAFNYFIEKNVYESNYSFSSVGLYKSGEYEITLVLEKSLVGFDLLYKLTDNWIVYEPYYEAGKTQVGNTDAWTNTYGTSVGTTMSYGPYKMTEYSSGQYMKLERNEGWFGYYDNKHGYVDPVDGKVYSMYETSSIYCSVVGNDATRKLMFLKGELMSYELKSEDFAEYGSSDRAYFTPSETTFFLLLNGCIESIQKREAAEGFDQTKYDIQTITLNSFRHALALTYDKESFASAVSPSRSGGYGLIGEAYVYDAETGAKYRDTEQAKMLLCDFYGVDVSKFESLDEAVASISGCNPEKAKELFTKAYYEALALGYVTDNDGDGRSDQIIRIEYCSSSTSEFTGQMLKFLNTQLVEVLRGTPFEARVVIYESAPYGSNMTIQIKNGVSDMMLAGWSGESLLDPFALTEFYTDLQKQYDAKWFDSSAYELTLTIGGEEITMSLSQWSDALNGVTVVAGGKQYNFGDGAADASVRLDILAAIEKTILDTGSYIPMLQDGTVSLLSKQVSCVTDEYNAVMGRGGIAYMRYNYNDTEWAAYVAECGGQVGY